MKKVRICVNGTWHEWIAEPQTVLLDLLREDLRLTGAKQSCDRKGFHHRRRLSLRSAGHVPHRSLTSSTRQQTHLLRSLAHKPGSTLFNEQGMLKVIRSGWPTRMTTALRATNSSRAAAQSGPLQGEAR